MTLRTPWAFPLNRTLTTTPTSMVISFFDRGDCGEDGAVEETMESNSVALGAVSMRANLAGLTAGAGVVALAPLVALAVAVVALVGFTSSLPLTGVGVAI